MGTVPYTMKLEGAVSGSFQTICSSGMRPERNGLSTLFHDRLHAALIEARFERVMGKRHSAIDNYQCDYGWTRLFWPGGPKCQCAPTRGRGNVRRVCLLHIVVVQTQRLVTRTSFIHESGKEKDFRDTDFHFSPSEIEARLTVINFTQSPSGRDDPLDRNTGPQ